jgi:prepilin-type N-terminal cleavage/methylation domain-containing protein
LPAVIKNNFVKRGFTLIELLVVISIISILSSIALASLKTARTNAKDVTAQAQLAALRTQGALYFTQNNNYLNVCNSALAAHGFGGANGPGPLYFIWKNDPTTQTHNPSSIVINGGSVPGVWYNTYCNDNQNAWAVETPSKNANDNPYMWCTDSTGVLRLQSLGLTLSGATACP